jgi:S-adenosyl-L-methionine hydrolase (adenosine-forming)
MAPGSPVIALLTDFGLADPYVGAMKGSILSVCPGATLVDVVHDLPPHDVLAGALALEAVHAVFPPGTIFVAVVDPGVGSSRRGLAAASGDRVFVGPDNGILSLVLEGSARVFSLEREEFFRSPVSPVFHGRDIFGPVAGHLAMGRSVEEMGSTHSPVRLQIPRARRTGESWEGEVLHVDRFGTLVTSITASEVTSLLPPLSLSIRSHVLPVLRTYSDVPEGSPLALVGSGGRLEVSVNRGNAERALGAGTGTSVRLEREKGG